MKKTILALVMASFAVTGIAYAGMDKQERQNSNAQWVHKPSANTYQIGRQLIQVRIPDLSTASSEYVYVPEAGVVTAIHCVIGAAITSADAGLLLENGGDNTDITSLTVTQSGSAIGDIDSSSGLSKAIAAGDYLELHTDGLSSTTSIANCTVIIDPAAQ
jgi:hypothetical protein